ncbi:S9 family peptidase [Actinospica durhamensis]|uniref:S9 family peptidase n=1 Tax=Actinospica durhamensis TaxID=1508375 RepID=A0A941ERW2_9ACTN|nr:S9 family peptidase [Actinospica durhamensis]MBR7836350.1 S9 family peptidase [Actinospica durhamensis]
MALGIRELLDLPTWRAFDIDDAGRILAGHDASGSIQLVELGTDGSATPLTALPGACSGRYLPGERAVVVVHDDGGNERAQLSLLRLDPLPAAAAGLDGLEPLVRDPRFIHNLFAVAPGKIVYGTNRRNGVDFDVVVRTLADGAETVVFDQGGMLSEVEVAPNGRDCAFTRDGTAAVSDQLFLSDAQGVRAITGAAEPARHSTFFWDADGRSFVVSSDRDREYIAVLRYDVAAGTWTEVVAEPERNVTGFLSPDGTTLLAVVNDGGFARLSLRDARTGALRHRLELPEEGCTGLYPLPDPKWSADSRYAVISFTGPVTPGDILRVDVVEGTVQQVTDSAAALAGASLARPELHAVPTPDGELVPCFVYRHPEPADPGLAASAVLMIHGGPEAQAVPAFNPLLQALAAQGHTILVPNVRGSDGYGRRWVSLDDVRLRLDSVADMAALHAYLPKLGVDQERAALYGGSYGGYMVLAGVAFQPELWAAAVDVVGISSLVTFLRNTSAYRRASREREYGSLEHDLEFLEQASPLRCIDEVRAPLFVIHGANDPRVPLSEAEQLVAAVRANDVPCELLVYPDEGHGLAKRANRLDAYPRALEFLARHLSAAARAQG